MVELKSTTLPFSCFSLLFNFFAAFFLITVFVIPFYLHGWINNYIYLGCLLYILGFTVLINLSNSIFIYYHVHSLSRIWLIATPWSVDCQAPLSMEFSSQKYWNGLPFLQQIFPTQDRTLVSHIAGTFFTVWVTCLENSMESRAWWAIIHEVTKSQTRLSN